jgi:uncharacterized protein (UPF0212 family)
MNLDSVAWSLGYRKCPECGYEYHESGTELCMCRPCEVANCDTVVNTVHQTMCIDCSEGVECETIGCSSVLVNLGPDTICPTCGGEGKIFVTEVMVEE